MNILSSHFSVISVTLILLQHCGSNPIEEELTLSYKELLALNEFKNDVAHLLPHDYMLEDIYLIKWLRAKHFDIGEAKTMLLNNLHWREENDIDKILQEDFSHWKIRYPFWVDGRDKGDRPVGTADISVWDPRPVVIAGKGNELLRYAISVLEFGSKLVRDDQTNGRNVTQFTLIANLNGFNIIQHACVNCIPFYIRFLVVYENYYPGMLHKFFMVNTPPAFETLLRIARPVLSKETTDTWSIHGTSKNHWKKEVLEFIESDQIRPQFGGTKKYYDLK